MNLKWRRGVLKAQDRVLSLARSPQSACAKRNHDSSRGRGHPGRLTFFQTHSKIEKTKKTETEKMLSFKRNQICLWTHSHEAALEVKVLRMNIKTVRIESNRGIATVPLASRGGFLCCVATRRQTWQRPPTPAGWRWSRRRARR